MDMGSDDYFAARSEPPAPLPVGPSSRANRKRGRLPGALLPSLLAMLLLTGAAAVVRVERYRAQTYDPLTAVTTAAVASAGWSPSYIDKAGRPARWDPCMPIHYVVQTRWMP